MDMVGQILSVEVTEVTDNGNAININFEYEGDTYSSPMKYSQLRQKRYEKFEEKFGIHIDNKEELVGKTVMVEVKKWAFSGKQGTWIDIKPFPKKKK